MIIFSFAWLLRVIYLLQIEGIPLFTNLAGDGRIYDQWAQRIAAGDWLGSGVFYQAPLYPYFLGVLQVIFGHDLWLIRLTQVTLGAIACALLFPAGKILFSREAGIASALILACYAPAIFFEGLIEKSIVDLFLLSLLLMLLSRALTRQRWSQWLAIGTIVGLLGLSRENALILAGVVPLWIGFYFSGISISARVYWIGVFLAGVLIVLVPVGVRNLMVGGEFKLTTSQFGANFFIGNNPGADGTYDSIRNTIGEPQLEGGDATRLAERAVGRPLGPGAVSDYWFRQSLNYIQSEPGHWLRLLGKKWLMVWNAREVEDSDDYYVYRQWSWLLNLFGWLNHFGILAPLAAAGLWLSRNRWRDLWLLYAMTLAIALSVTIFFLFGRYRFPLVPLLALFAGHGVVQLARLYKQAAWRPFAAALGISLASAVFANWPIYGMSGPWPGGYNNLSNAYYKQGKVKEATENALKAVELQPDFGVAHYNLGNLYAFQVKLELAQRHFERAVQLHPNYAEARSNLGQLIAERGDLEGAIEQFRKAIELNPSISRAHLNLGVALAKQGKLEESVQALQQAIRLVPNHSEAHYYLGSVYAAQSRYDQAAQSFQDVLRIQADNPAAHQSLAQVLSLQGKKQEAVRHYEEALKLMKQKGTSRVLQ